MTVCPSTGRQRESCPHTAVKVVNSSHLLGYILCIPQGLWFNS